MKVELVYLEWVDAFSNSGWFTKDEMIKWAKNNEWIVKQAGWLIEETKDYLVFATTWKPELENSLEQYANVHKIPKAWVRKKKVLTKCIKEKP